MAKSLLHRPCKLHTGPHKSDKEPNKINNYLLLFETFYKMKNSTVLIACLCLLIISAGSCKNPNKNNTTDASADSTATQLVTAQSDIEVGYLDATYFRFKDFHTRMAIPKAWQEGAAIQKEPSNDDGASAEYKITFTGQYQKENQYLGSIYVFTPAQWEAVEADQKGMYALLGETEGNQYVYKSTQSNPYGSETDAGKEFDAHVILMPNAKSLIRIEKEFPLTVNLDKRDWEADYTLEGGIGAQNNDGLSLSLATSTVSGRGLKSIADVKSQVIQTDKTAKLLKDAPTTIGGYNAVCYTTNAMSGMEYACVAYIQTSPEDFKVLVVGGNNDRSDKINSAFKDICKQIEKR